MFSIFQIFEINNIESLSLQNHNLYLYQYMTITSMCLLLLNILLWICDLKPRIDSSGVQLERPMSRNGLQ